MQIKLSAYPRSHSATLRLCVSKAPLPTKEGWPRRILLGTGWFSLALLLLAIVARAQVPAPKDVLGWTPGEDRKLASWAQVVDYFKKLDAASDRVQFQEIGKSTMGAPFVYATISSPENLKNLEKYKKINAQLADPRTFLSRAKYAERLIEEGKTIVLITCGIHSTEVGSYLSSMLIAHRLASSNEPEIQKILQNTIILLVPSLNPDGVDIVNNWYQKTLGTPYEGTEPPELYHKYVGHDDNRDWYAFTQVETQLTVDKIHNVWHPQIVHDIHQQGQNGSRLFLPPYMQPVEPNVPKQIVEGYTELGNYMAADLRAKGFVGITTNSTYDAWTPARAYSHYHGGVRILSETASAKLATPVNIKFENLRVPSDDGYDPKIESANFGPLWRGGEWHLSDITRYMTTAAFSLLNHAADNREKWLTRFYEIGKEAVRPRKNGELHGYILPPNDNDSFVIRALATAGVELDFVRAFSYDGRTFPEDSHLVRLAQPYGAFAKALLERQTYPDLKDSSGHPIAPYDVTSHTISLLTGIEAIPFHKPLSTRQSPNRFTVIGDSSPACIAETHRVQLYRSHAASMDEGWTRFILRNEGNPNRHPLIRSCDLLGYSNILSGEIRDGKISARRETSSSSTPGAIIFPDQSPNQILNGYAKGTMPDEYVGGVGKEGVENLKKFVEAGGTLVFLNRASEFAIEQFNLPVRNVVKGLNRKDFYIPGSILRTELDTTHPIAKGMPQQSIAWFENGPVFEVEQSALAPTGGNASVNERASVNVESGTLPNRQSLLGMPSQGPGGRVSARDVRIIARYPTDPKQTLLSGWALGAEKIAGKAALVEVTYGKGKIILFGFRPQYRGQSLATFPLFFNAIAN